MKKLFFIFISLVAISLVIGSCSQSKSKESLIYNKEMFDIIDEYIRRIAFNKNIEDTRTTEIKYTRDNKYSIGLHSTFIMVNIIGDAELKQYTNLVESLKKHYKNNFNVVSIYFHEAPTSAVLFCRHYRML
jgi:hypothetical protein